MRISSLAKRYLGYLEKIDSLVQTDFSAEMECKMFPKIFGTKPYTQAEAREMANIITKIYSESHKIHCSSCAGVKIKEDKKYVIRPIRNSKINSKKGK